MDRRHDVLPARLSGTAAGIYAYRYIGKVCSFYVLVQADNIRPRPRARPRGHGEMLKLLRKRVTRRSVSGHIRLGHRDCSGTVQIGPSR